MGTLKSEETVQHGDLLICVTLLVGPVLLVVGALCVFG